jgi:hypothetical protein
MYSGTDTENVVFTIGGQVVDQGDSLDVNTTSEKVSDDDEGFGCIFVNQSTFRLVLARL